MIPDAQPSRRLPVYILADRSASMAGDPIVAVNQGMEFLKYDLENEPRALETVWLSVISFGGSARLDAPLTELITFQPPKLNAEGSTPLGEALRMLNKAIDSDVTLSTADKSSGDYRPLIFLFTDGDPTDDWRQAAAEVKQRTRAKAANIIAVGCGPNVKESNLKEITENVLLMENVSPGNFLNLIAWISSSVKSASVKRPSGNSSNTPIDLPPPPPGFRIVL